jgi:hypothetical protein
MPTGPIFTYSSALFRWSPARKSVPMFGSVSLAKPSPVQFASVFGPLSGQVYSGAGSWPRFV